MENLDDDDTFVFEPAVVKLTPFDRRLRELRALRDKRDELSARPDNQRRIAEIDFLIKKAEDRLEEEKRRGSDDEWRRMRDIDDWRSRDGRELRNASRRKVRSKPNEDLSHLTPDQKDQRKRDQRADANFIKRRTEEGSSVSDIEAALLVRQQKRDSERKASEEAEHQLSENPAYGIF